MEKAAAKPRPTDANLKRDFSSEELAENGRKGGVKSGETRRRQRTFRESVKALMQCGVLDEDQRRTLEAMGLEPTMLNQIQRAVFEKAAKGDVEAARYLRDTAGEKPREGLEIGNLDDQPLMSIDMSKMSDEQLKILAAKRSEDPDE